MLFSPTRQPIVGEGTPSDGYLPASVYFGILFYLAGGSLLLWRAIFMLKRWRKMANLPIPQAKFQLSLWVVLFATGLVLLIFFNKAAGIIFLFLAQVLPVRSKPWLVRLLDYDALEFNK